MVFEDPMHSCSVEMPPVQIAKLIIQGKSLLQKHQAIGSEPLLINSCAAACCGHSPPSAQQLTSVQSPDLCVR